MATAPPRRGRFTLLMSPTLLTLLFLLAMGLCGRQNLQMDVRAIHPSLAARLSTIFDAAAQGCSLVAGAFAFWLAFRRFRSVEDAIATAINILCFGCAFSRFVA